MSQSDTRSYDVQIDAPPERVWKALTDPELTEKYYFGTRVESDWTPGGPIRYRNAEGGVDLEGEILEYDPPRRLSTTFRPTWAPEVEGVAPSRVSWDIREDGGGSRLTLRHEGYDWSAPGADMVDGGWQQTVPAIKGVVESHGA